MHPLLEFRSGWSLGELAYQAVLSDLKSINATTIVEFGSGTSTLRLSHDLPTATILSIEGEAAFAEETRANLSRHGGSGVVELVHRPICWQRHGMSWFRNYTPGDFPREIDAVLIDGPPIATRRGREACLYQVFEHTREGTRFYLDDYCRNAEQQIVRNWLRAYGAALKHLTTFEVDHRVAVLERASDEFAQRGHWRNTLDSLAQNARQLLRP